MREIDIQQSEPKMRLVESAEQLVADRGFDLVSVRDITQAAKANVAAVNYHFGSREGLMGVLVVRHLQPVQQERLARLEVLEKKWGNKAIPLEELVEAFVRPVAGMVRKSELPERVLSRLVGRMLALESASMPASVAELSAELASRFSRSLAKSLPGSNKEDLAWRLHFLSGGLIHLLVAAEELQKNAESGVNELSIDLALSRFIRFAVSGLREGTEGSAPAVKKGPQAMFDF